MVGEFNFEHSESIQEALLLYKTGKADFSDYVSYSINRDSGCLTTYSFDQKGIEESIFELCPDYPS